MPTPLGFHIGLRLEGDRNLAPDTASRRVFARTVLKAARPFGLLACRWVDTHGHMEIMGSREEAGEAVRRAEIALQRALEPGSSFVRAYIKPMMDFAHVKSTFAYVLGQQEHHGVVIDPFHDASNGPDLIGARTIGARTALTVRKHLPRVRREDILEWLGMEDPESFDPAPFGLAEAGAAAIGVEALVGSGAAVRSARRAIVHFAELPVAMLAEALGVSVRTVHRLRAGTPDEAVLRALRQQLAMRQAPMRHRSAG
jgi:hypothetical protein